MSYEQKTKRASALFIPLCTSTRGDVLTHVDDMLGNMPRHVRSNMQDGGGCWRQSEPFAPPHPACSERAGLGCRLYVSVAWRIVTRVIPPCLNVSEEIKPSDHMMPVDARRYRRTVAETWLLGDSCVVIRVGSECCLNENNQLDTFLKKNALT